MSRRVKILLLSFFFALCGAAAIGTYMAREHTAVPAARELYSVVNRQLSALRESDFDTAYRQAASGVQQKFSRAQFELMIRRDFSSMTQPQKVEFGTVEVAGPAALVQVFLTARNGNMRGYLYSFSAESGGWKINGVQPLGLHLERKPPGLPI